LHLNVRLLSSQGIRHLIMCTGYLADQIENEFRQGHDWDVEIEYSKETHALGTAGAIRLARDHLSDVNNFFVLNGDSFLELDFDRTTRFHQEHSGIATMAVVQVENAGRYGAVRVDK